MAGQRHGARTRPGVLRRHRARGRMGRFADAVSPYGRTAPLDLRTFGQPQPPTIPFTASSATTASIPSQQSPTWPQPAAARELPRRPHGSARRWSRPSDGSVSDGHYSYAPKGCWFNGIDSRNGRAYDISDWDGTSWPTWHWTRQLPYILHYDYLSPNADGKFAEVHAASYRLLRHWMAKGEYFRKYGFVSNTGWTGMGGRHDETMCGYGQASSRRPR